jgi:hypothetical protein
MTMYLPNRDIRPTGYEAGEFLDAPPFDPELVPAPPTARDADDEDDEGARS